MTLDVADYIAFYAAILATVVFVRDLRRFKKNLNVTICYCYKNNIKSIAVNIKNLSPFPVYLKALILRYPHKQQFLCRVIPWCLLKRFKHMYCKEWMIYPLKFEEINFPAQIESYDSISVLITRECLRDILNKSSQNILYADVQDAIGSNFSKVFRWKE